MMPIEVAYLRARIEDLGIREPILEVGAGWDLEFHRKPFREHGATRFYAHDFIQYDGAPLDWVGDLCAGTKIPDAVAGSVVICSVLEHLYAPWRAADELARILQPGGLLFGSVPCRTEIHRHPNDYWRFCPEGVAALLRSFRLTHIAIDGSCSLPANVLFAGVRDTSKGDWLEENLAIAAAPEVILGNDYTTVKPWKRRLNDLLRRRLGLSIERWQWPSGKDRMAELGYKSWSVRSYQNE